MLAGTDLISVGKSAVDAVCTLRGSAFSGTVVQRLSLHAELLHHFYGHLYVCSAMQALCHDGKVFL